MLRLFVLPSGRKEANVIECIRSFIGLDYKVTLAPNVGVINDAKKDNCDWFMIVFDNEYIKEPLRDAIPVFLEQGRHFDIFSILKKVGEKTFQSPRIFKSDLTLEDNSFRVKDDIPMERYTRILDGMIWEFEGGSKNQRRD